MKRVEFTVKLVVILLLTAGLLSAFFFNDKQPSSVNAVEEEVVDVKVAIGKGK